MVEQLADDPPEPARGDVLGGRVDGDHLVGEALGLVALAQHLVAGVGHGEPARPPFEFARERRQGPDRQAAGVPRLVEPGARPHPAAGRVGDADLKDPQVAPRLLLDQVLDRAGEGDDRALLGMGQVGQLAAGEVAARVVFEQVADGVVAEGLLQDAGQPAGLRCLGQRHAERVGPARPGCLGASRLHHAGSIGAPEDTPADRVAQLGRAVLPFLLRCACRAFRLAWARASLLSFYVRTKSWPPSATSAASTRASACR
jgi:hypothetical protein